MKCLLALFMLIGGALVWRAGERMSSDAISMSIGVLLGILTFLPVLILFMSLSGSRERRIDERAAEFDRMAFDQARRPSLNITVNRYGNDSGDRYSQPALPQYGYGRSIQAQPQDRQRRRWVVRTDHEYWLDDRRQMLLPDYGVGSFRVE